MATSLRDIAADIARETGEWCSPVVADRYLDMALMLHADRVGASGNGWCEGGYCCNGTNLAARDAEYRAIAAEARELDDEVHAAEAQQAECEAGTCGHYTCTEGGQLSYWAGNDPRLEGNF